MACVLAPLLAQGAVFTVTSTADVDDVKRGDGVCATDAAVCTLRAAIREAEARTNGESVQIDLPAGRFTLQSALPAIKQPLTITGHGPADTVVDGNQEHGLFDLSASVTIERLTIRGGLATRGGGINVSSPTNVVVVLRDMQLMENAASLYGGALHVGPGPADVRLERVSITGNDATVDGSAIAVEADVASKTSVTVMNATISSNLPSGEGHDIVNGVAPVNGGTLSLDNVTLVGNLCTTGGITFVRRSILEEDPATGPVCANPMNMVCPGPPTIQSNGDNLEHGTSCPLVNPTDLSGIDPELKELADWGGGTLTHKIGHRLDDLDSPLSPAIDHSTTCALSGEDQRGEARPVDADGEDTVGDANTAECDIGAFEYDPDHEATTTTTSTTSSSSTSSSTSSTTSTSSSTTSLTTTTVVCPLGSGPAQCPFGSQLARMDQVGCLVDRFREQISQHPVGDDSKSLESFAGHVARVVDSAAARVKTARDARTCTGDFAGERQAKKLLKRAAASMARAAKAIRSNKGVRTFGATDDAPLTDEADGLRKMIEDIRAGIA